MSNTEQQLQKVKKEAMQYLESQGYSVSWEEVLARYGRFADNPQGPLENEIDSVFAEYCGTPVERLIEKAAAQACK